MMLNYLVQEQPYFDVLITYEFYFLRFFFLFTLLCRDIVKDIVIVKNMFKGRPYNIRLYPFVKWIWLQTQTTTAVRFLSIIDPMILVSLILYGCESLTTLPPEIGDMTNLIYFDLSLLCKSLTTLPPEIGNLTNLTYLTLCESLTTLKHSH